jgi:glycosyltransferase involved in cell wall biosynthesis
MKIAIVNQPFDAMIPPYQNSIGLWTYHTAACLAISHEVTVFAKRNRMQKGWKDPSRARYRFITCAPNRISDMLARRFMPNESTTLPPIASKLYTLDYITLAALAARAQHAQIVHVHNFTQYVPVIRALYPRAKIVLHMSGEWLSSLDRRIMRERAEKADLILGASNHITRLIAQRFPELSPRCKTLYNGVRLDWFQPVESPIEDRAERRILFVGRISPEKGVHVLVEAFVRLAERFPNLHLDLVGPVEVMPIEYLVKTSQDPHVTRLVEWYSGDYGARLRQLIPPHLAGRVRFAGNVPQAQLPAYYQSADILANPSFSESFGMSLVEAMACGKPVVATRVGGMVEIVEPGKTGFLVEQGSSSALADALATLLEDDALRAHMGKQGRERAAALFGWEQIAHCLLEYYHNL